MHLERTVIGLAAWCFWYLFKLAEWGTVWFTTLAWMLVSTMALKRHGEAMFSMVQPGDEETGTGVENRFSIEQVGFLIHLYKFHRSFLGIFRVVSQLIWFRTTPFFFLGFPWTRSHFTTILYLLTLVGGDEEPRKVGAWDVLRPELSLDRRDAPELQIWRWVADTSHARGRHLVSGEGLEGWMVESEWMVDI